MSEEDRLRRELEIYRELLGLQAQEDFASFMPYVNPKYDRQWFHKVIADYCQWLFEGSIKNLMVFIPPQHGKSEIVSRSFPAWALGQDPDLKIVGCSYSSTLSQDFCRNVQRTIDSEEYHRIFPNTYLRGSAYAPYAIGYKRNADMFETVGHRGFYKGVGVGGSLTGTPVDIGIIDDPVKGSAEAYSETIRNGVWEWYNTVFRTRLHNDSKQLFIMTRWHEDDLAGRILKHEAEEWVVLKIPALRESVHDGNNFDPRKVDEALWEKRHSRMKLKAAQAMSARTFSALYQQSPTIDGGNIIKEDWFQYISRADFDYMRNNKYGNLNCPIVFFCDTAYTEKTSNDPTGIIGACMLGKNLYITSAVKVYKSFPRLISFMPDWVRTNGYAQGSSIRIEPKANGLSVIDQLRENTKLNITKTKTPSESKETRLNTCSPFVESGRVYLVKDENWNEEFVNEVCGFPALAHDEYVDLLCYAIDYFRESNDYISDNEILRDFL